jgi:hypothetical protein
MHTPRSPAARPTQTWTLSKLLYTDETDRRYSSEYRASLSLPEQNSGGKNKKSASRDRRSSVSARAALASIVPDVYGRVREVWRLGGSEADGRILVVYGECVCVCVLFFYVCTCVCVCQCCS